PISLRAAPLPGPAPAANTTASAPSTTAASSSARAASRSSTAAVAPACSRSGPWSGLRTTPVTRSPRPARRAASRNPIFPCPPATPTPTRGTGRPLGVAHHPGHPVTAPREEGRQPQPDLPVSTCDHDAHLRDGSPPGVSARGSLSLPVRAQRPDDRHAGGLPALGVGDGDADVELGAAA